LEDNSWYIVTNAASSSETQVSQWKLDLEELGIPLELEEIIDDAELPVCSNYGSFAFDGLIMKKIYKLVVIDFVVDGNIGADADMTGEWLNGFDCIQSCLVLRIFRRKSYNNDIGNDQGTDNIRECTICGIEFSNAAEKLYHDESVYHATKAVDGTLILRLSVICIDAIIEHFQMKQGTEEMHVLFGLQYGVFCVGDVSRGQWMQAIIWLHVSL